MLLQASVQIILAITPRKVSESWLAPELRNNVKEFAEDTETCSCAGVLGAPGQNMAHIRVDCRGHTAHACNHLVSLVSQIWAVGTLR